MRVLVTGGAGYIGSVSVRLLLDEGHDVTVLDSLQRGWRAAVDVRARFVDGSVGDSVAVEDALKNADAVLHCAGLIEVAESQEHPDRYFRVNTVEPCVLLEAMLERGIDAIVFSSTAAVYGEPDAVPIPEGAPTRPVNAYGASKLAFENVIEGYGAAGRMRSVRFRYFNVAGAWPDGSLGEAHDPETHIIPRILQAMHQGERSFEVFGGDYPTETGTCVRDYLHVCDLARAHVLGLEHLASGGAGGVFNLGSGVGMSNLDVVNTCAEVSGREIKVDIGPRRCGDPAVLIAASDRAELELGWTRDRGDLRTIVEDAWAWHIAHPNGYR
ncbi:MAG: UDP-glucose 4-epimerase GalE [Coriobacteriales bacterium]|nr:UDP-glucose 4-epimerase GalE [Coriobacteriales bacterium]